MLDDLMEYLKWSLEQRYLNNPIGESRDKNNKYSKTNNKCGTCKNLSNGNYCCIFNQKRKRKNMACKHFIKL